VAADLTGEFRLQIGQALTKCGLASRFTRASVKRKPHVTFVQYLEARFFGGLHVSSQRHRHLTGPGAPRRFRVNPGMLDPPMRDIQAP
jgi:hypothetical protein